MTLEKDGEAAGTDTSAAAAAELLERIGRLTAGAANKGPLKPVQWQALRYLAAANRFSNTPGAVTDFLGATKGTVSQTLIALEGKGLVARRRRVDEGRSVSLELTDAARQLLETDPLAALTTAIRDSGHAETLREGLAAVLTGILASRGGRTFGMCHTCRHFRRMDAQGAPHRCALLGVPLSEPDTTRICREHETA